MQAAEQNIKLKENKFRYPELDALRGIAVLSVMLYHYTFAYDFHYKLLSPNKLYLAHGNLAVHLFFIISGFVIFLTLQKSKTRADFPVSRFSRLYPAYWASMLVTILFISFLPVPTLGNYTFKEIGLNLTMFQGFTKVRLIDQVYWTLKMELTFYIIMYLLFLNKALKNIEWICVFWLALSLISALWNIPLKKYLDVALILEYAPLFIAGINFYRIKNNGPTVLNHVIIASSFLLECRWLLIHPDENYGSLAILAIIYSVFYLFTYQKLSWLNNRVLLFLGTISYSLYLLHNVIGYTIIYRLRQYTDVQAVYVIIPVILSITIATLMTFFIEKPAIRFIRNSYKKHSAKQIDKETKPLVNEIIS